MAAPTEDGEGLDPITNASRAEELDEVVAAEVPAGPGDSLHLQMLAASALLHMLMSRPGGEATVVEARDKEEEEDPMSLNTTVVTTTISLKDVAYATPVQVQVVAEC